MKIRFAISGLLFIVSAAMGADFRVTVAGSMEKIPRDGGSAVAAECKEVGFVDLARDEAESFQAVVIPREGKLENVQVKVNWLNKAEGLEIQWYRVGYVKTGNPGYFVENLGFWPDILWRESVFDVEAGQVQPIWVTVSTTPETPKGVYKAELVITAGDARKVVPVMIKVRSFVIPRPGKLAAPFGLYRSFLEEWYFGKRGKLDHKDFLRMCHYLAKEYRITAKNIGYEYIEKEYGEKDGQKYLESVDYSKTAEGLKTLSNRYFADYSYGLYRMPSGPTVHKALEDPERYSWCTPERIASDAEVFFKEFKKLGFNDKAYIYGIDEVIGDDMFEFARQTYKLVREKIPDAKIMQTGNCNKPELIGLVDIWCPKLGLSDLPFFQERLKEGDILWEYVCCSPVRPFMNLLVDQPGIEHRILMWHTQKIGGTGFLYWTVISGCRDFEPKPWEDAEKAFPNSMPDFTQMSGYYEQWVHVNGDGQLLYPGEDFEPIPSIRLELVRDSIEDYEYFEILREKLAKVKKIDKYNTAGTKDFIAKAEELLRVPDEICKSGTEFTDEPTVLLERRKSIADMIDQLNDILINKDYMQWKR